MAWGAPQRLLFHGANPGLPHDDFRRTHDNFWRAHNHYRRPDDDCVMMFIPRVPAPPAIRNKASGGGKEAGNGD